MKYTCVCMYMCLHFQHRNKFNKFLLESISLTYPPPILTGIECELVKIVKIKDLLPQTSKTGVTAIRVLGNYYRLFIKGFSRICERLTCSDVDFSWEEHEQLALDKLKEVFCSAPILAYPNHKGEFIIDTDTSNYAIGAVLSVGERW